MPNKKGAHFERGKGRGIPSEMRARQVVAAGKFVSKCPILHLWIRQISILPLKAPARIGRPPITQFTSLAGLGG